MRFACPNSVGSTLDADIDQMCMLREKAHLQKDYQPKGSQDTIAKGTYYLTEIDSMYRRKYEVKA